MTISGVLAAQILNIKANTLTISGYILATESAVIKCTICNFEAGKFIGMGTWTVNGRSCSLKDNKLTC